MANRISFFSRVRLFREYRKALKKNRSELETLLGLRVDRAHRMYTVLNVPEEVVGEAFSLKKSDIDRISENYIKEYLAEVGRYLNAKDMAELYSVYEIKKVDKYSYLVVIGFAMFRSNELYDRIYLRTLPVVGVAGIVGIAIWLILSLFM
jgi:hypothetical protein